MGFVSDKAHALSFLKQAHKHTLSQSSCVTYEGVVMTGAAQPSLVLRSRSACILPCHIVHAYSS